MAVPSPTEVPADRAPIPADQPAPDPGARVAVRLEGVSKRFGDVVAVDAVDLEVFDGEFFSMLGPSGSGKTTTLRMIAGFELPTEGRILLHGEDVSRLPPFDRDVNTVFQDYALFPHMSVGENVGYGLLVRKVPEGRARGAGRAMRSGWSASRATTGASRRQLSGGQRQRVALARALVNRPRVLLLDEPLGALDLKLREEMQIELKSIQQEVGITFIYVTHDQEEALTMSDRLAVFNRGRIEQIGTPGERYERPATQFVAGFVGTSNLLRGDVASDRRSGGTFTVRPEKIRIGDPDAPVDSRRDRCAGAIREVVYLGPDTRYHVALDAGRRAGRDPAEPGDDLDRGARAEGRRVRLMWKRQHCSPSRTTAGMRRRRVR